MKIIGQTAKIAITMEGLGVTEAFLSGSIWCDTGLGENIETELQHFLKKVLETFISNKHTQKIELNDVDIKITKNYKNWALCGYGITMY